MILGSVFVLRSVSESNLVRNYTNATHAFWIAEAGLAQMYYNWAHNNAQPVTGTYNFSGNSYTVDATHFPQITVTGLYAGLSRAVQATFSRIPAVFDNTLSVGNNLSLTGLIARADVYGKTRITGSYSQSGATGWFEDKQVGVNRNYTTITIPDYSNNGTSDEFSDFVSFGRMAVQGYPANQVVYIQNNGTINILPDQNLVGKKVVFVEGQSPGQGNVNIYFDGTWQEGEDLTVISTGNITYVEPLQYQTVARLSAVCWGEYNEASVFRSEHESVIFAHDSANFADILDWGSTTGNVIANNNVYLREVLSYEKYYYTDRSKNGDLPPAFLWLTGASGTSQLIDWQEAAQ